MGDSALVSCAELSGDEKSGIDASFAWEGGKDNFIKSTMA